jgi:hypothetical protein
MNHIASYIAVSFVTVLAVCVAILMAPHWTGLRTNQNLAENQPSVLGVDTDLSKESLCPSKKPIIGWITPEGQKQVRQNLPLNQKASTCFGSIDEAHINGFY